MTTPLVPATDEPAPILKADDAVIVSVWPTVAWEAIVAPLMKRFDAWSMVKLVAASVLLIVGWLKRRALLADVPVLVIWVAPEKFTVPGVKVVLLKYAVAADAMVGAVPVDRVIADTPEVVVLGSRTNISLVPKAVVEILNGSPATESSTPRVKLFVASTRASPIVTSVSVALVLVMIMSVPVVAERISRRLSGVVSPMPTLPPAKVAA